VNRTPKPNSSLKIISRYSRNA
jgi:hypothetical protein